MKISVIMPVYNSEKFIRQALESILNQDYRDLELIVVDDGSTDGSAEVVRSLSDSRVRYFYQANKGVRRLAETINVGLAKASGDLVTMFPSDDLCEAGRFSVQAKVFEDPGVVLSFGKMRVVDDRGAHIGETKLPNELQGVLSQPDALRVAYTLANFIPQPTVMFRRSALASVGGYSQPGYMYAEDYPTQMKFVGLGRWVYIDQFLARYRLHGGQMTRTHVMPMYRTDARYRLSLLKCLGDDVLARAGWDRREARKYVIRQMNYGYFAAGLAFARAGNLPMGFRYLLKATTKCSVALLPKILITSLMLGLLGSRFPGCERRYRILRGSIT